jgi:quercetin dioxygenase-like cupin family protein
MPDINPPHDYGSAPITTPNEPTSLLIKRGALPGSPDARRFTGAEHHGLPISLFLVDDRPGTGPLLHRHPYPELFVVHAGDAEFQIDGAVLVATAGDVVIAPAATAHRFANVGTEQLRITAIHTAPRMSTEWLQSPATRRDGADATPC